MELGLRNKCALVTAASQGLGRACAEALAREGAQVAICSRSMERITRAADEINLKTGDKVLGFVCDITQADDIERLVTEVRSQLGHIDILVFNHGNPPPGSFLELDIEQWKAGLALCLWPAIRMCQFVVPEMKSRHYGRIIFISSIFAKEPDHNYVISSTLRSGLLGFAKCIARDLASYSITVNTVLAGYFDTPLLKQVAESHAIKFQKKLQQVVQEWANMIPTKTLADPLSLGQLVAWLSSSQANNLTGVAIPIDGGLINGIF